MEQTENIRVSECGKMYAEHSHRTTGRISEPSSKNLQKSATTAFLSLDLRGGRRWSRSGSIVAGGYSIAWRTFDAQYWGVPQHRRRIYLVADFRGQRAEEILFKRAGLSRSFATSREAWNGITADNAYRSYATGECYDARGNGNGETCPTITGDHNDRITDYTALIIATNLLQDPISGEKAPALSTGNPRSGQCSIGVCYALDRAAFNQGENAQYNFSVQENLSQTLVAKGPGAVCYPVGLHGGKSGTLDGNYYKGCGERNGTERELIAEYGGRKWIVRRLTPKECARLQGMPDWWCDGVEHKDAPEYKMWGNGMALPNVMYVLEGIVRVLQKEKQTRGRHP